MATTPEVVQKRYHIPAELGTRDVPRSIYAITGARAGDRKTFLCDVFPKFISGALAGEGHSRHTKQISQAELAGRAGCSRITVTRRTSRLAQRAQGYGAAAELRQHAQKLQQAAQRRLEAHRANCEPCATAGGDCPEAAKLARRIGQIQDEAGYAQRLAANPPTPLLSRRRHFAAPNSYCLNLPERRENWIVKEIESGTVVKTCFDATEAAEACDQLIFAAAQRHSPARYEVEAAPVETNQSTGIAPQVHYPTIEQLKAAMPAWVDPDFSSKGFKAASCWIWDARLCDPDTGRPLGTLPRLVMATYEVRGLLDKYVTGRGKVKPAGVLQIAQNEMATYLGIDVKTLYRANQIWAKLGILRIVSDEREEISPGKWVSQPMKVIYLPFRMLTEREAALESARIAEKTREIVAREGAQRLAQLIEAQRIHSELLAGWAGREHCLGAFWKEYGRRLEAARIFPDLIAKLVPLSSPPGRNPS